MTLVNMFGQYPLKINIGKRQQMSFRIYLSCLIENQFFFETDDGKIFVNKSLRK